jgi:lysine-N-methylase
MAVLEIERTVWPRYLDGFACIGGACESSCCSRWQVDLDRESFLRIQRALSTTDADRKLFEASVKRQKAGGAPNKFALTVLRENGDCSFLDQERLCTLQRRFGEKVLSITCASYPRERRIVGGRLEITATASCPELARRLLLRDDATEWVEIPYERAPHGLNNAVVLRAEAQPWRAAIDAVRDGMLAILLERGRSLAARLGAIGCAAEETRPWFHARTRDDARARLAETFDRYGAPSSLAQLERELPAIGDRPELSAGIVLLFLQNAPKGTTSALQALLRSIVERYEARDGATRGPEIYAAYQARRDRWQARHLARVETYFGNWATHYVLKDWYLGEETLAAYVERLFVRVATLRFLLFSHPLLDEAEGLADEEAQGALLDRAVVDVVHRYTRGVEHNFGSVAKLDAMVRAQAPTLAHVMFLLNV